MRLGLSVSTCTVIEVVPVECKAIVGEVELTQVLRKLAVVALGGEGRGGVVRGSSQHVFVAI